MSLFFAGLNDVVFKRYSVQNRPLGMYVCGIGLVWTFLQAVLFALSPARPVDLGPTVVFGLAAGTAVCLANILLLESLKRLAASVGSTIYRLNTVGVVLISFAILDESLGWIKAAGIGLAVAAVLFLYESSGPEEGRKGLLSAFWVAVAASLLRAVYGVVIKVGLLNQADSNLMLSLVGLCWLIGGLVYAAAKEKNFHLSRTLWLYSALSGLMCFLITLFLTLGLERGEATVVIPIANLSFLVAISLAVIIRMERLTLIKGAAVAVAVLAVICLSQS